MAEREEPTWEVVHTDPRPVTRTPYTQERLRAHHRTYTKPRPARWWAWHCEVCNAPMRDDSDS